MKYKEFFDWCDNKGWDCDDVENCIRVPFVCTIYKTSQFTIKFEENTFHDEEYSELIIRCIELAKTPLAEREGRE